MVRRARTDTAPAFVERDRELKPARPTQPESRAPYSGSEPEPELLSVPLVLEPSVAPVLEPEPVLESAVSVSESVSGTPYMASVPIVVGSIVVVPEPSLEVATEVELLEAEDVGEVDSLVTAGKSSR